MKGIGRGSYCKATSMILVDKNRIHNKRISQSCSCFSKSVKDSCFTSFTSKPWPPLLLSSAPLLRLWNQERTPASPLCLRQSKPRPSSREILNWSREPKLWEDECECSFTPSRLTVITCPQLMLLLLSCSGLFWTSWFRRRRTTSKTWASWWRWDTCCLSVPDYPATPSQCYLLCTGPWRRLFSWSLSHAAIFHCNWYIDEEQSRWQKHCVTQGWM